jgi:hypothetical protein
MDFPHGKRHLLQKRLKLAVTISGILLKKQQKTGMSRFHKNPQLFSEKLFLKELFENSMGWKSCQERVIGLTNRGGQGYHKNIVFKTRLQGAAYGLEYCE